MPEANKHVKHQAVIEINDAVRQILFNSITKFIDNAPVFDTKEVALEWLIN